MESELLERGYFIQEFLGEGGFGKVFKGLTTNSREVSINFEFLLMVFKSLLRLFFNLITLFLNFGVFLTKFN